MSWAMSEGIEIWDLQKSFSAQQILWFCDFMDCYYLMALKIDKIDHRSFSVYVLFSEVIKKLSECYSSQLDSMNAEIRIRWLQIVVRNDYYPDLYKVRRFLENQVLTAGLKSLHLSVHETCAWDMRRERPWNFCFLAKCSPGVLRRGWAWLTC